MSFSCVGDGSHSCVIVAPCVVTMGHLLMPDGADGRWRWAVLPIVASNAPCREEELDGKVPGLFKHVHVFVSVLV